MPDLTEPVPPWHPLVEQLAALPVTIRNLLDEHAPLTDGTCSACTVHGGGLHTTPWPCSLHALAVEAQRIAQNDG